MSKSIVINIETQTEASEVISIAHVNEKSIALEVSREANIIYKRNRQLFNKINKSTKLLSGKLIRHAVVKSKARVNRLMTIIDDEYESNEEVIAKLEFSGKDLKLTRRGIFQRKFKADFDPTNLAAAAKKRVLDLDNITRDDVNEAVIICQVQEIDLFKNIGVKSFMFVDNLKDQESLNEVAYELELKVDTDFGEYVDYVLSLLKSSINFIEKFYNTINIGSHYDYNSNIFKKNFVKDIMSQLNIDYLTNNRNVDMSNNLIKASEFGVAATNYYNGMLLLKENTSKEIYQKIISDLLPTNNNTPQRINFILKSFNNLYNEIERVYGRDKKSSINNRNKTLPLKSRFNTSTVSATTKNKFKVETDKIGYNIFSNSQKGLNDFTVEQYTSRFTSENKRYYSTVRQTSELDFMTPAERSQFLDVSSVSSKFLTPVGLVMGEETIDVSRGLQAVNVDKIKQFRLLKTVKAKKLETNKFASQTFPGQVVDNTLKSFNLSISQPVISLADVKRDQLDEEHIDAESYVGSESLFLADNPTIIRANMQRIVNKLRNRNFNIISEITPELFLRPKNGIKSIQEISLSNSKSKIVGGIKQRNLNLTLIPPQIRSMMMGSFLEINKLADPIKNPEAKQVLVETQQNVFMVTALIGFERDQRGFVNVNMPIYRELDLAVIRQKRDENKPRPILVKVQDYEVPELGIVKDKLSTTIYNNLAIIRG